jgi:7-cyano-7-deazaguanine synthase in queuosine biosynthesis
MSYLADPFDSPRHPLDIEKEILEIVGEEKFKLIKDLQLLEEIYAWGCYDGSGEHCNCGECEN